MIQDFINYQALNKGLSKTTVEGYRKELKQFVIWATPQNLTWSTITDEHMKDYVAYEQTRGMKPRTIKRRVEVVRLLFSYAIHKGMLKHNPAQYTQTPKIREQFRPVADTETIDRYLATEPTTRQSYIVHLGIALMMDTGMRLNEALNMYGTDINTDTETIKINGGKGGKDRLVCYGDRFRSYANNIAGIDNRPLDITGVQFRYMMYNELGNKYIASPHMLRHAFACNQLNAGMPLKDLSTLMGHKHAATTEIYAKMSTARISETYKKYN